MKRNSLAVRILIVVAILLLFSFGQIIWKTVNWPDQKQENILHLRRSQVRRFENKDTSLEVPFLDKISNHWYVGGDPEIRNAQYIRLTTAGTAGQHGSVISNGIGDNIINNFEIIVKFRIMPRDENRKISNGRKLSMGDGMAIVISSEKDFISPESYASGYAKKQFELNSDGVLLGNTEMMGFPKNLPGLCLIIDTFQNNDHSRERVPFLDIHINNSPRDQQYDSSSDGADTRAISLLDKPVKLDQRCVRGDMTQIRIIYMESINTLKIDAQYEQEGEYWIELFNSQLNVPLPKNRRSGERYVGVSALTGQLTETVDIFSINTNEFHWENHEESVENSFDYAKEVQMFLAQEFNQMVSLEEDKFQRWKIIKSQPNFAVNPDFQLNPSPKEPKSSSFGLFSKILTFGIFIVLFYLASVYIRVRAKHTRRRRAKSIGLLPM